MSVVQSVVFPNPGFPEKACQHQMLAAGVDPTLYRKHLRTMATPGFLCRHPIGHDRVI
jgi:hypothetical protein